MSLDIYPHPTVGCLYWVSGCETKANSSDVRGKAVGITVAQQCSHLLLMDYVLYRKTEDTTGNQSLQVIVPKVSRSDILHQLHLGELVGHL